MKKFIICFILAISIMLSLCACYPTTVDEQGVERTVMNGFVIICEQGESGRVFVVYHQITKVVYYLDSFDGFLSPYIIYQDSALYGAIYQDDKITPVPYAYAPLE